MKLHVFIYQMVVAGLAAVSLLLLTMTLCTVCRYKLKFSNLRAATGIPDLQDRLQILGTQADLMQLETLD